MTTGIHHVTSITADVQANVDFYMGFLGLNLVKQTSGFEDAEQLHLFYGAPDDRPGTLVSFMVWEATGRGRTGLGQVSEIAFAVPTDSLGEWMMRAISANIVVEGPIKEFGEPVLRLKDPDGLIIKLVASEVALGSGSVTAPCHIRGVTILSDRAEETSHFLGYFGYEISRTEGSMTRLKSDTDVVDVHSVTGFVPSVKGAGVPDHVAFRAPDTPSLNHLRDRLKDHVPTMVRDLQYFSSFYVRDSSGLSIECATDLPGMTVNEPEEQLGLALQFPPEVMFFLTDGLRIKIPQFSRPGEMRGPKRDLPFVHRFYWPEDPDGSTIVLLHGPSGDEADLMPLAHRINPRAALLGVRARATEEGNQRWFRRLGEGEFDQKDIRSEAAAFNAFLAGAIRGYALETDRLMLLGYSNGADMIGAMARLYPDSVKQAVMIRPTAVLSGEVSPEAGKGRLLVLSGSDDNLAPQQDSETLKTVLEAHGHQVDHQILSAGHWMVDADEVAIQTWLTA